MYPMLKECVSFETVQEEGSDEICYQVHNAEGEVFEVDQMLYSVLLEGKKGGPLNLTPQDEELIPELVEYHLVDTGRWVYDGLIFYKFIVFPCIHCPPDKKPLIMLIDFIEDLVDGFVIIWGDDSKSKKAAPFFFQFFLKY